MHARGLLANTTLLNNFMDVASKSVHHKHGLHQACVQGNCVGRVLRRSPGKSGGCRACSKPIMACVCVCYNLHVPV